MQLLKLSTTADANSPIGAYSITPTGGTSANYSFTHVAGLLSVVAEAIASSNAVISISVE
jgi:hypothetical protein